MDEASIERIREKLAELSERDHRCALFGANNHRYRLRRTLKDAEIRQMEARYGIALPDEYRMFLLRLSDGGAGPDYGVFSLKQSLERTYDCTGGNDQQERLFAQPFPHTQPWNMGRHVGQPQLTEAELQVYEVEYFRDDYLQGTLRIHTAGCNHDTLLVLSGPERGNLWHDERTVDYGLFPFVDALKVPHRLSFFAWYEEWLDKALGLRELDDAWPTWYRNWLNRSLGLR